MKFLELLAKSLLYANCDEGINAQPDDFQTALKPLR